MISAYPIIEVPFKASQQLEQLGTKAKFWFRDAAGQLVLFKEGRPGTGENWAEKIACELAAMLGLPHAHYDLARCGDRLGVVSPNFAPKPARLIHGNEVLGNVHADYEETTLYRARQHTLRRIFAVLRDPAIQLPWDWSAPPAMDDCRDVFVGYLLLDALIGNQDRHHENWGLILREGRGYLAPTFDHASSLGRNETDENRASRLTTNDIGRSVKTFAARARSAIYTSQTDRKPMKTSAAFTAAARIRPDAAHYWLSRLASIDSTMIESSLERLPLESASELARRFALELMLANQQRLLAEHPESS